MNIRENILNYLIEKDINLSDSEVNRVETAVSYAMNSVFNESVSDSLTAVLSDRTKNTPKAP